MPPGERNDTMSTPPGAGNAVPKNDYQLTSGVMKSSINFELTMPPGAGNVQVLAGDQQPPTPPGAGNAKILDPDATMMKTNARTNDDLGPRQEDLTPRKSRRQLAQDINLPFSARELPLVPPMMAGGIEGMLPLPSPPPIGQAAAAGGAPPPPPPPGGSSVVPAIDPDANTKKAKSSLDSLSKKFEDMCKAREESMKDAEQARKTANAASTENERLRREVADKSHTIQQQQQHQHDLQQKVQQVVEENTQLNQRLIQGTRVGVHLADHVRLAER